MKHQVSQLAAPIALALVLGAACGGGGYDAPSTPGSPTSGNVGATITIRADGTLDQSEVRIAIGERVRFVNQDGRQHEPKSNPHLQHTDCPAANVPILTAGQSATSEPFPRAAVCGIHDHLNPDALALQGTIRVGGAEGPGGPVYVKH